MSLWSEILQVEDTLFRKIFNHYRPELHYMRGPGPKWLEKHSAVAECAMPQVSCQSRRRWPPHTPRRGMATTRALRCIVDWANGVAIATFRRRWRGLCQVSRSAWLLRTDTNSVRSLQTKLQTNCAAQNGIRQYKAGS